MSIFMLETESANSAASSIDGLTKTMNQLASDVSGYDTSSEDAEITAAFDAAKSTIANNLDACVIKIANTSSYINTAVSSHTSLQENMKFMSSEEKAAAEAAKTAKTSTGGSSSGGSYSGGGYTGGGGGGYYSAPVTPTPAIPTPSTTPTETSEEIKEEDKPTDLGYDIVDKEKLDEKSKKIFEDKDFKYKDGYAMLGERFIIICDSSLAKVGDILKFTQNDGTVIECVVGLVTTSTELKKKISFVVEKKDDYKEKEEIKNLLKNNKKLEKISKTDTSTSSESTTTVNVGGTTITNGNVIDTNKPVGEGTKYNLSDDDLSHLAYVALREQGSVEGAKLELSLMANLYEKNKNKYKSVRDYVDNSGWFASGSRTGYSYPGDAYVQAAREVLNNGKRYLPSNVVEHDCISDLTSSSTGSVSDRSSYIPGKTILKNRYGARYMFVGFAPNGGDPFGYLV